MIKTDDFFNLLYYTKLPQVYRDYDKDTNFTLKRYLEAQVYGGHDYLINGINQIPNLIDPQFCPPQYFPDFYESFGLSYFPEIDVKYHRKMLAHIGEIIKRKGTYAVVSYVVKVLTGLNVNMYYERGDHKDYPNEPSWNGRWLYVEIYANTLIDIMEMDNHIRIIKKYLSQLVPFNIRLHLEGIINTQALIKDQHIGIIKSEERFRSLVPLT